MGLMDFFFERTEEKPASKPVSKPSVGKEITENYYADSNPEPIKSETVNSNLLSSFQENFERILADANNNHFPGTDFYEFSQSLKMLMDAVPDEKKRFVTAFNIERSKAADLTKDKLIKTAKDYITVIDKEANEFTAAFNQRKKEQIDDKTSAIQKKQKEMADMEARLMQLKAECKSLAEDVENSKKSLSEKEKTFAAACDYAKGQISTSIEKISNYL